jgi:hypothetical protein
MFGAALPQPAVEKPIINVVAASQPVQTEAEPQSNDALFRQFQAWVDAQADAAPSSDPWPARCGGAMVDSGFSLSALQAAG